MRLYFSLFPLEHFLIGLDSKEKQWVYQEQRKQYRIQHNIPDHLNVKGANIIPARVMK